MQKQLTDENGKPLYDSSGKPLLYESSVPGDVAEQPAPVAPEGQASQTAAKETES
jgi:hypothetical protein